MALSRPPDDIIGRNYCWDAAEIVATRGGCLHSAPPTPVFRRQNSTKFAADLTRALDVALFGLELRRRKYGDIADQWPPGHTPIDMRRRCEAEMLATLEAWEAPSPSTCSECDPINRKKSVDCLHRDDLDDNDTATTPELPTPLPSDGNSHRNSGCFDQQAVIIASTTPDNSKKRQRRDSQDDQDGNSPWNNKRQRKIQCNTIILTPDNVLLQKTGTKRRRREHDVEEDSFDDDGDSNQRDSRQNKRCRPNTNRNQERRAGAAVSRKRTPKVGLRRSARLNPVMITTR